MSELAGLLLSSVSSLAAVVVSAIAVLAATTARFRAMRVSWYRFPSLPEFGPA